MEYAVTVAVVLPWVAMIGTAEVATDRTVARAMATIVALAVEAPCTMERRGPCRGNPRISTVARGKTHGRPRKCHGHCRGPPPKSKKMCICDDPPVGRHFNPVTEVKDNQSLSNLSSVDMEVCLAGYTVPGILWRDTWVLTEYDQNKQVFGSWALFQSMYPAKHTYISLLSQKRDQRMTQDPRPRPYSHMFRRSS